MPCERNKLRAGATGRSESEALRDKMRLFDAQPRRAAQIQTRAGAAPASGRTGFHSKEFHNASRINASIAGPRGRARLRPAGLQREQPGAGPGDHGGGGPGRRARDHAGIGRRA
ncbi:hypothetical protein F01_290081 [Burkholderia cenocepacia]|nr:hypothetical protein F01_290081 [Burkholderia cenocepacia]